MNRQGDLLLGMLVGAGLMYLLDPERGRRRRALLRDQLVHGAHELEEMGGTAASSARHLRNQAQGWAAETRARLRHEEVDDAVLEARVRSELGRLVSTPGAIEVAVTEGTVTLSGEVLADESEALVEGVGAVRGVASVQNRLTVRQRPGDSPDLQGAEG